MVEPGAWGRAALRAYEQTGDRRAMHTAFRIAADVVVSRDLAGELRMILKQGLIDNPDVDAFARNPTGVKPADSQAGVHGGS
jgi:hypothetical protein